MKICLLIKDNKPFIKEVISLLQKNFKHVDIFTGNVNDIYPLNNNSKSYDVLISYLSPWIVKESTLKKTKIYNINFHPGPPEFPGTGCYNFALYKNSKTYGVTAHFMEKSVDTGRIIRVNRFNIDKDENVISLMRKSYIELFKLFKSIVIEIKKDDLKISNEKWKRRAYSRKELNKLQMVTKKMKKKEIEKRIRATYIKDQYSPYILLGKNKFIFIEENEK